MKFHEAFTIIKAAHFNAIAQYNCQPAGHTLLQSCTRKKLIVFSRSAALIAKQSLLLGRL